MRNRKKRRHELDDGGRATAAASSRGTSNAGSSLESILDIVSKVHKKCQNGIGRDFRLTYLKTLTTICTARSKKRNETSLGPAYGTFGRG